MLKLAIRPVAALLGLTLLATLAGGCSGARTVAPRPAQDAAGNTGLVAEQQSGPAPTAAPMATGAPATSASAGGESALTPGSEDRMIIRTAELSLAVKDTEEAAQEARTIANDLEGYVADSQMYHQGERLFARLTVRVPAKSFEIALQRLKATAVQVIQESTHGQDVTEEYVDLQAQLKNLELTEKELQQLLSEIRERTSRAEDVLAVYRQLVEIRGQIEQLKGRMQYLERSVGFSTIQIEMTPSELARPVAEPGWQPLVTLHEATRSLVGALQTLADLLIWLIIYLLPILVVLAIPVAAVALFIRFVVLRRRRGRT
jgi:hypothetical protein